MSFRALLPSSAAKPAHESGQLGPLPVIYDFLTTSISPPTWLLMGACVQSALVLLVSLPYSLFPAALLLAIRFLDTLAMTYGIRRNRFMDGVVMGKASAQVRDRDGEFTEGAAEESIVVLHLGAKSNHPFGFIAPEFIKMANYFTKVADDADEKKADNGFLGQSFWTCRDKNGSCQLNTISYWRTLEDLHAFAHGPVHREAWDWWAKTLKQHDYLGINHEIYSADKGQWENIYVNFQPTGLGATTYLRKGDKLEGGIVADEWVSPLVQANKGKLRTSSGRLGRSAGAAHNKYGTKEYEY